MKRRFEISRDSGFNSESGPKREVIKTFKNEPEARAFYNDPRNKRRYGTMYLTRQHMDGISVWDDRREEWVTNSAV